MRVPFHASTPNRATMFGVSRFLRQFQTTVPPVCEPPIYVLGIWEAERTVGIGIVQDFISTVTYSATTRSGICALKGHTMSSRGVQPTEGQNRQTGTLTGSTIEMHESQGSFMIGSYTWR